MENHKEDICKLLKFGTHHNSYTYDGKGGRIIESLKTAATTAEVCGFDSFWLSDHLHQLPVVGKPEEPMLDGWTALAALATTTRSIRLGTMVTANTSRNPALLAKIGATVDVLSNGRMIMGIGAANYPEEAEAYGIRFPPISERFLRLEESVQILKKMWTEEMVSFKGAYYHIRNAYCNPKPVQKPHPPIVIGGNGEKKTLRIVAKYGDACNMLVIPPEAAKRLLGKLKEHCELVGRDYRTILKTYRTGRVIISEDSDAIEREILRSVPAARHGNLIYGNPEDMRRKIEAFRDAGFEYIILNFDPSRELDMMRLFSQKVMKNF